MRILPRRDEETPLVLLEKPPRFMLIRLVLFRLARENVTKNPETGDKDLYVFNKMRFFASYLYKAQ